MSQRAPGRRAPARPPAVAAGGPRAHRGLAHRRRAGARRCGHPRRRAATGADGRPTAGAPGDGARAARAATGRAPGTAAADADGRASAARRAALQCRGTACPRAAWTATGADGGRSRPRLPSPDAAAAGIRSGWGGAPRTPGGAVRARAPQARRPAGPNAVARRAAPRPAGQLARTGRYRRVHRQGFVYPQVYGSYFYSPVFGYGYGYDPYYYRYPRAYGSYFYFGGYPYTTGYGYPWIYDAAWGYGQTPYYGYPAADYSDYYQGSLRLKIKPRDAEVYADGYYVGVVDSFDGVFQRLRLEEGPHRIEIRHPDYRPIVREVLIVAGETVKWEERMQPL